MRIKMYNLVPGTTTLEMKRDGVQELPRQAAAEYRGLVCPTVTSTTVPSPEEVDVFINRVLEVLCPLKLRDVLVSLPDYVLPRFIVAASCVGITVHTALLAQVMTEGVITWEYRGVFPAMTDGLLNQEQLTSQVEALLASEQEDRKVGEVALESMLKGHKLASVVPYISPEMISEFKAAMDAASAVRVAYIISNAASPMDDEVTAAAVAALMPTWLREAMQLMDDKEAAHAAGFSTVVNPPTPVFNPVPRPIDGDPLSPEDAEAAEAAYEAEAISHRQEFIDEWADIRAMQVALNNAA